MHRITRIIAITVGALLGSVGVANAQPPPAPPDPVPTATAAEQPSPPAEPTEPEGAPPASPAPPDPAPTPTVAEQPSAPAEPTELEVVPPPGDDLVLDTDAHAILRWSVPDRYGVSWSAYRSSIGTYDAAAINPAGWSMKLDGCASTAVHRIDAYEFRISQVGTTWSRTYTRPTCALTLGGVLPAQGSYRVSLTLHTSWSASLRGVSRPTELTAWIRDYLVVSIGDSLASGEGNPDVVGSYSVDIDWDLDVSVSTIRPARWRDSRCHRSEKSGPAIAAKSLEAASPYTSVTFISLACSGAEVRHLISDRYEGIAPSGQVMLPPQVEALAALVGPGSPRGGRQIDALLVSAGINNLGFSDIIERCVLNNNFADGHIGCVTSDDIAAKVDELTREYAYLALHLAWNLPDTKRVYLNGYPSDVFRGGACGVLAGLIPSKGINAAEAAEMNRWGHRLNQQIARAVTTFAEDPYRWNAVPDLAAPFRPHAYCDRPSWFRTFEQSVSGQGDVNGTAHPNAAGHLRYASLLLSAIDLS